MSTITLSPAFIGKCQNSPTWPLSYDLAIDQPLGVVWSSGSGGAEAIEVPPLECAATATVEPRSASAPSTTASGSRRRRFDIVRPRFRSVLPRCDRGAHNGPTASWRL